MHIPFPQLPALRPYGVGDLGFTLPELAAAITRQEGACSAPGVCTGNNPGNLRAYAAGQPVDSRGIRIFPSYQAGYDALLSQERVNISKGVTLDEFFAGKPGVYPGYAPAADRNQPSVYAGNVSTWAGIPRDVPLLDLLDAPGAYETPGSQGSPEPAEETAGEPDAEAGLSTGAKLGLGIGAALLLALAV